jgi:hypothetical protein
MYMYRNWHWSDDLSLWWPQFLCFDIILIHLTSLKHKTRKKKIKSVGLKAIVMINLTKYSNDLQNYTTSLVKDKKKQKP